MEDESETADIVLTVWMGVCLETRQLQLLHVVTDLLDHLVVKQWPSLQLLQFLENVLSRFSESWVGTEASCSFTAKGIHFLCRMCVLAEVGRCRI